MSTRLAAVLFASGLASAQAAPVTFDDRATFDAATAGLTFVPDGFDADVASADAIEFASGIRSVNSGGNRFPGDNAVTGGRYVNNIGTNPTQGSTAIDWTLPGTAVALAFDFASIKRGVTTVSVNGVTRAISPGAKFDPGFTETSGFFGIVDMSGFSSLSFGLDTPTANETFRLDDLSFSTPAAVPLPAPLLLLAAALGALGLARRRAS